MLDHLISEVGFGWSIRISAFLILALLVIGNLTVKSRLPPRPKPLKLHQYFKPLGETTYLLTTIASFLFYLGLFLPINYIQVQSTEYGISTTLASYTIPILNAARSTSSSVPMLRFSWQLASLFGRILPGLIGDKLGRYNTHIVMCFFSGIIVLALWLPAKANTPLIMFAALYGLGSGAFVSLIPAVIAQISDIREIGLRIGTEFAVLSFAALVSNPIGGALITRDHGKFRYLQIWCGVILLAGSTMYILARASLVGFKIRTKVWPETEADKAVDRSGSDALRQGSDHRIRRHGFDSSDRKKEHFSGRIEHHCNYHRLLIYSLQVIVIRPRAQAKAALTWINEHL